MRFALFFTSNHSTAPFSQSPGVAAARDTIWYHNHPHALVHWHETCITVISLFGQCIWLLIVACTLIVLYNVELVPR